MILFACPSCGQKLEVEQQGAGLIVSCPTCAKQLTVPNPAVKLRVVPTTAPLSPFKGPTKPKTTAIHAGVICLIVSVVAQFLALVWFQSHPMSAGWIIYLGLPFYAAATICAIVAMCTDELKQGLLLLAATAITTVLFYGLYQRAGQNMADQQIQQFQQQMKDVQKQFQNSLPQPPR